MQSYIYGVILFHEIMLWEPCYCDSKQLHIDFAENGQGNHVEKGEARCCNDHEQGVLRPKWDNQWW